MKKLDWFELMLNCVYVVCGIGFIAMTIVAIFVEKNVGASILGVLFVLDWIVNARQMWGK